MKMMMISSRGVLDLRKHSNDRQDSIWEHTDRKHHAVAYVMQCQNFGSGVRVHNGKRDLRDYRYKILFPFVLIRESTQSYSYFMHNILLVRNLLLLLLRVNCLSRTVVLLSLECVLLHDVLGNNSLIILQGDHRCKGTPTLGKQNTDKPIHGHGSDGRFRARESSDRRHRPWSFGIYNRGD
jgi:hypothetical protein